jgi:hypothetical protein
MDNPKTVFCYAAKFNYPAVADVAAPYTLGEALVNMEKRMWGYPTTIYAWVSPGICSTDGALRK